MSRLTASPPICPATLPLGGLELRCTRQCEAHTNHQHVRWENGRMVVVSWKAKPQ